MLASLLNYFDEYDAYANFHQLQEGGPSCLAHNELGSIVQSVHKIVQMDFYLFI